MLSFCRKIFLASQIAAASILVSCGTEIKVTVATKDCADKDNPKCKKSGAVEPGDTNYFNVNAPTWTWGQPSMEAEFTVSFSDTPPSRSVPGTKALSYTPSIALPDGNYTLNVWSRALPSQDWVIYSRIKSVIDTVSPVVTGITAATADGTYGVGASIDVIVGFSEVVYVTGTPTLKLGVLPNEVDALYQKGSGQLLQVFRYTVGSADRAARLDVASDSALSVTAGSFKDIAGNEAVLTVPAGPTVNGSLAKNSNIGISTAPVVLSVTTTKASGNYKAGVVIPIIVEFSKAVTVTGTPHLILESGISDAVVDFVSIVDGTKMQFDYTVRAGDTSSDLEYRGVNALSLNNGSIKDSLGNDAIRLLPDPNTAGSLAGQKTLIIDTTTPTISFNSFTPASPGMSQTPIVRGTTSEQASVLLYSDGSCLNQASTAAEQNTVFASPGITATSLTSNSSTTVYGIATDLAGNTSTCTVLGSYVHDGLGPAVTIVSSSSDDIKNYKAGESIAITITFSEIVAVTGTPQLTLETGANDAVVNYYSGSPGKTLTFNFVVEAGHSSSDLDYVSTSALALNGGTIKDAAGNSATLTLPSVGSADSLGGQKNFVVDTAAPTVSSFVKAAGQNSITNSIPVNFTITFAEAMNAASFTAADISNTGTATGVTWTVTSTSATTFTVAATVSGNGTLIPRLAASGVTDAAGNANASLSIATDSVNYSTSAFTVTVNQAVGQADPVKSGPINFTAVFSSAVGAASFTSADITQSGTAAGVAWTLSTSDNITWTLAASGMTGSGTVIPTISAAKAVDAFGNNNSASTSTDNTVTYDVLVPILTFSSVSGGNPGSSLTPTILGTASETSTVILYYDSGCATANSVSTANTTFASPGITLTGNVNSNTTTIIYGKAIDTAGNSSICTTLVTYNHDNIGPIVSGVNSSTADGSYKASQAVSIQVAFSEVVTVTGAPQLTLETGTTDAVVNYASGSGTNTLTFTYTVAAGHISSDLDYVATTSLALNAGTIKDAVGNNATLTLASPGSAGSLSANKAIVIDTINPTMSFVAMSPTSPGTSQTPQVTVNISEASSTNGLRLYSDSGCATAISATATGTSGNNAISTTTLTANTTTNIYGQMSDLAGNTSTCMSLTSYIHDGGAPTVINVNSSTADGTYGVNGVIAITLTFSETVNVTGTPQITLETGTTDAVVNYSSGSGTATLTFNYTVAAGHTSADLDYTSTTSLALNTGTIKDAAGNNATLSLPAVGGVSSIAGQKAIVIDTTAPTITFTSISPTSPGTSQTPSVTLSLSEATATSGLGLFSNVACTTAISSTATGVSGSNTLATTTLAANLSTTIYAKATDVANNASSCISLVVYTHDSIAPTISSFAGAAGQNSIVNTVPINFTITFSEAMNAASFTAADISNTGTAAGVTWTVTSTSATTFTVAATVSGNGTLIPRLAASGVTDAAGNANASLSTATDSVNYSTAAFTVTVNQAVGQADPVKSGPINFTAVFSSAVGASSFTSADITQSGTAAGVAWTLSTSDNITWTLAASGMTGSGTVIPTISAAKAVDTFGNNNSASTSTDNTVVIDMTAPTISSFARAAGQNAIVNSVPINFTITFSETISAASFTAADISNTGTAAGVTWTVTDSGNQTTFTVAATASGIGTIQPSLAASAVNDTVGNSNAASINTATNLVSYRNLPVTVTVNQASSQVDPTNNQAISFTVVFSTAVGSSSFDTTDITQNGTATGITWSLATTDSITYTLSTTAILVQGSVMPSIAANKVVDTFGNSNTASTSTDNSVILDTTAPLTPVIADASKTFEVGFSTSLAQNIPPDPNFKEFRYTLDGVTTPSCSEGTPSSTEPTSIAIPGLTTTLKAVACDLAGNSSDVATSVYTKISTPAEAPSLSISGGTFYMSPVVQFTSGTPESTFAYTQDGSVPTCAKSGTESVGLWTMPTSGTLNVVTCAAGSLDSAVTSAYFSVTWVDVTKDSSGQSSTCADLPARCSYLLTPNGIRWSSVITYMTWNEAKNYCNTLDYNGKTGWRLPTVDEGNAVAIEILNHWRNSGAWDGGEWLVPSGLGWEAPNRLWTSTPDTWGDGYCESVGGCYDVWNAGGDTQIQPAIYGSEFSCVRPSGPAVSASWPLPYAINTDTNPNGTAAFTLTYADAIAITLSMADISLVTTGTASATVASLAGTGSSRTVTLSSISGVGNIMISLGVGTASNSEGSMGGFTSSTYLVVNDTEAPAGYTVAFTSNPINAANQTAGSFSISGAEVDATYNYSITSSGGGTPITGSGAVSSSTQIISGIDVSGLYDGTLTVSVRLTDRANNIGLPATAEVIKDLVPPTGYGVTWTTSPVTSANYLAASFQITSAEVGATYSYTITSNGGGSPVTGTGTVTAGTHAVTGINLSDLRYGILTAELTLTDLGNNTGSKVSATVSSSANSTVACETHIGWLCSDGTVYAGISPDGQKAMYVARCDNGQTWDGSTCSGTRQTRVWGDLGCPWTGCGLGLSDPNTGKSNSAAIATNGINFQAAYACENLNQNGYTDWYLPAVNELEVMYVNRKSIGNFLTDGDIYWSSSEGGGYGASSSRFSDVRWDAFWQMKYMSHQVRCARRAP